jgi:hypothetical protein
MEWPRESSFRIRGVFFHSGAKSDMICLHAEERGIRLLTDRWEEFNAKHLLIETRTLLEGKLSSLLEELLREVGMRPSSPLLL